MSASNLGSEHNETEEVVVSQDQAVNQEEIFYWMTIADFVDLMLKYGTDNVMRDFQIVAKDRAAKYKEEHPIIVP